MNGLERKELKRATSAKERWRSKAKERSEKNHFLMEKVRETDESRQMWRARAEMAEAELKKILQGL